MSRLWDKGEKLNVRVHRFTVGDDPQVDRALVESDLIASAAHAKMLLSQGLLTKEDCRALLSELSRIAETNRQGKFSISEELEDCHTAIESTLVEKVGEAGRRIHTGRSRNDQVLVAMRVFLREQAVSILGELLSTAEVYFSRAEKIGHQPMPGYTHFQPAMPSSVAMWLQAFGESALEQAREGFGLLELLDSNPLGVASGFGSSLPLDRKGTAKSLGFSRVQRNPIAVQNSRGHYELKSLRWASDIAGMIEKFACDMILYTTREFGFFTLPTEFTTGSSIMPQKHNPDVIELLRGRAAKIRGAENELAWVIAKLPSNYHRDFQYTKEPLIRGLAHLRECLGILHEVVQSFQVNSAALEQAMSVELYATYDVYREVKGGKPFREAYQLTAERVKAQSLKKADLVSDFAVIAKESDAELAEARIELKAFQQKASECEKKLKLIAKSAFEL